MFNSSRICIVGGGGIYTPHLVSALTAARSLAVRDIRLMDIDEEGLETVLRLSKRIVADSNQDVHLEAHTDCAAAVRGCDVVIIQCRVGNLSARSDDIDICLRYGLIGEETTGVGGISYALRAVPVLAGVGRAIRANAPSAFVLNVSNPTGLGTAYLVSELPNTVVGLCTTPWRMHGALAEALGCSRERLDVDYFGLNHLGWIFRANVGGRELSPTDLVRSGLGIISIKEAEDLALSMEAADAIGAIPSPYLLYHYKQAHVLGILQSMRLNRAQVLMNRRARVWDELRDAAADITSYGSSRHDLYQLVVDLLGSLSGDGQRTFELNVSLPRSSHSKGSAVFETRCTVDSDGIKPQLDSGHPSFLLRHAAAMIDLHLHVRTLTLEAATNGDYNAAMLALVTHPLGPDSDSASAVLDDILDTHRDLLPQFG